MVNIPYDYVELDCREEGKVNLPEIHVTIDTRSDWMELREAKLLQIIREMFGGMENSLYICGKIASYYGNRHNKAKFVT